MWTNTSLTESVPPDVEPVTAQETADYGRIDEEDDQPLLDAMITASRQVVEAMGNLALISRTYEARWDCWPKSGELWLPRYPVSSIAKVEYYDADNTLQTWTGYDTDIYSIPARITLSYGETWPTLRERTGAIIVTYVAGYGATGESVPTALKMAVKAGALALYELRDSHIESNVIRDNPVVKNLVNAYAIRPNP
jgi:uncharacterized phiE125 gp8 family phage protein